MYIQLYIKTYIIQKASRVPQDGSAWGRVPHIRRSYFAGGAVVLCRVCVISIAAGSSKSTNKMKNLIPIHDMSI